MPALAVMFTNEVDPDILTKKTLLMSENLNEIFEGRWIWTKWYYWPSLKRLYFLWRYLKDKVYQYRPVNIEDLICTQCKNAALVPPNEKGNSVSHIFGHHCIRMNRRTSNCPSDFGNDNYLKHRLARQPVAAASRNFKFETRSSTSTSLIWNCWARKSTAPTTKTERNRIAFGNANAIYP